jgi:hypothetical protein
MTALRLAAAAALIFAAPAAHALTTVTSSSAIVTFVGSDTFDFTITGWDDGGVVTGSFTGIDGDADGQLSWFDGEVSGFVAVYTGGTLVADQLWTTGSLFGLVYDLDGEPLGDGVTLDVEGIGAANAKAFFAIGPGPIGLCDIGEPCGVIETVIPEPGTWAMMIAGFGLVGATLRRRRPALA